MTNAINPVEAIRTYKRCVIVGDPGAGKTTLLKYLTLKSVDNQLNGLPDLPIHIELNAFASSGYYDLLDFASAVWDERYGFPVADARDYMEEQLEAGNALLLLDALDETVIGDNTETAESSYSFVAEVIMQVAARYHQSPIVVTARKAGYQQRAQLAGFTEMEVLDFRAEDMRQFVTNWFNCYPDPQRRANAEDLITKFERAPRIQALAANPLLLSLIVLVYEAQLDLPDRRAELYKRCVATLLTEWDAKRNIRRRREFKPEHKYQLLAEIAWHFHVQGRRYFPESELLTVIADFLPKVRLLPEQKGQILAEIANEQGLLKEQARGWQGFLHLTLQEYFVAQYVLDNQQLETLLAHRGDPWWEEVLLLYAGHTPDASPLLRKLLGYNDGDQLQEDLFQTNLILAGRCLAARPTIRLSFLWETVITQLFDTLTTTRYSLTKEQIAYVLAAIGDTQVIRRLLRMISDEQIGRSVRESIALALGNLGERSIAPDLVKPLSDERVNVSVRESTALALGNLGERSIAPDLVKLLSNSHVGWSVRRIIATALSNLGERSIAPDLMQLLSNRHIDRSVRGNIALALSSLGERSIAPDLVKLLSDERLDASIRGSIALALGNLGERSIAPDLVKLLSDKQVDWFTRKSIALALGNLGEHSVAPDLVKLLSDKQRDQSERKSIALALGNLGERSIAPDLVKLLSNKQLDASVRESIALALGNLGERSVVPDLVKLLSNGQAISSMRESIALALGNLGERSVVPDLVKLLSNKRTGWYVRQNSDQVQDVCEVVLGAWVRPKQQERLYTVTVLG